MEMTVNARLSNFLSFTSVSNLALSVLHWQNNEVIRDLKSFGFCVRTVVDSSSQL